MLLSTKIYYSFYDTEHIDTASFEKRLDAVCRELGDRGKPIASRKVSVAEGVPPALAPALAPVRAPAAISVSATPPRAALATVTPEQSFSPSMQMPSMAQQRVGGGLGSLGSLGEVSAFMERQQLIQTERDSQVRAELMAEMDKQRKEMQTKLDEVEAKMTKQELVSAEQLLALQTRLEVVHASQLLTDDELYLLEDLCADFLDLKSSMGTVAVEMVHSLGVASKVHRLVGLSEGLARDGSFARQLKRKFPA